MGLFGQSSPFDVEIDKATSEKNTSEPWDVIMNICDKVGSNPRNAKDCLKAIMRRMAHPDPHVVIQAVTLLDACVNNCGKNFHLEVASREFENEFKRLLMKSQPQVATKMRLLLKKWAENDFKTDPQLNLIPTLYHKLKSEGHDFTEANQKITKSTPAAVLKDPNVVTSQQEEEDIAKAIELSLKDTKNSKKQTTSTSYPSLYPSFSGTTSLGAMNSNASTLSNQEPRKVRALYDFEAAEDNELTFTAGEIIHVLDDSDPNWWKGYNQRGEGLFPSNFVTADLSVELERLDINQKTKKSVQFEDKVKNTEQTDEKDKFAEDKLYVPEINEEKIDRLLHLLHEANPEDSSQDNEEMLRLEEQVNKMGPLIDAELERVDRKHAQLTQLSSDLVDAINLYHTLMREPDRTNMPVMGGIFFTGYNPPPPQAAQSLYGPSTGIYAMQNMYHPNSHASTSLSGIPVIHTSLPGQVQQGSSQQQITSHPSNMPILGNTGPNNYAVAQNQPQMIPMQYQNGHLPSLFPLGQQQPQYQLQNQTQQTVQNINQLTASETQHQQNTPLQSQSSQRANAQINPNLILANLSNTDVFTSLGVNAMPNMPGLIPPGAYQSQHQSTIGNSLMGSATGNQPQSHSLSSQPQLSTINQPVTHTILGSNDSKTVIPIHQQQR